METVGYLGPEGSYSHLAALTFRPNANVRAYASFNLVMDALLSGACGEIVLPIENSLNGGVNQNIDLLQNTEGIIAFEECTVEIDHRLATLAGAGTSGILRIYSHQQALAQCGNYLNKYFPAAELIAVPSTAASLKKLQSPSDACIVGAHVKRAGIVLSDVNIADQSSNVTHFLLVKRGGAESLGRSEKIYFSATCPHKPGALLDLLAVIKNGGLNMTKIQSRPIKDKPGEYRFFIEVEGDYCSDAVKAVLENVKKASNSFKLLGAY